MTDDPINPAHYAGRACADIGERLSANGYQILKYCWRLNKKDAAIIELGKAAWYAHSESLLLSAMSTVYPDLHTQAFIYDLKSPNMFLVDRIEDQPLFTQNIARMLWNGYNMQKLQRIVEAINEERHHHAGS